MSGNVAVITGGVACATFGAILWLYVSCNIKVTTAAVVQATLGAVIWRHVSRNVSVITSGVEMQHMVHSYGCMCMGMLQLLQ